MSVYLMVHSRRLNRKYKISAFKSYRVEQSIDIPADGFSFSVSNINYEVSNVVSAGDYCWFVINGDIALKGYIDDIIIDYGSDGTYVTFNGRDRMATLLDNHAWAKTYTNMSLKTYLGKILKPMNIKWNSSSTTKFKKITIEQGESEYAVIERLAKDRNRVVYFDSDEVLQVGYLASSREPTYTFSNTIPGIKVTDVQVSISNDIRDKVVVYGEKTIKTKGKKDKTAKIRGEYEDKKLKTFKRKLVNDSAVETTKEAIQRAKEEFYEINKDAFIVNITMETSKVIKINRCARVYISEMGLNVHLLVDSVEYTEDDTNGAVTNITLKMMPGISVSYKNNDIPTLPKLNAASSSGGSSANSDGGKWPGTTYRTGSRGETVKKIQAKVGTKVDGVYGRNTYKAVMTYQRKNGLRVDGIVGEKTWNKMF